MSDGALSGDLLDYEFVTAIYSEAGAGVLDVGTYRVPVNSYAQKGVWVFEWMNRAWSRMYVRSNYTMRKEQALVGYLVDDETQGTSKYKVTWDGKRAMLIDSRHAQSRDVVTHEWGHGVLYWRGDANPGHCPDPHYWDGVENVECSWNEGFPNFLAVSLNDDDYDTSFHWNSRAFVDVENMRPPNSDYDHDQATRCEGNVASALYDLVDSHNDFGLGYENVVGRDIYAGNLHDVINVMSARECKTFSQFWANWLSLGKPGHLPIQAIRLNRINFNHAPIWSNMPQLIVDPFETVEYNIGRLVSDLESGDSELIVGIDDVLGAEAVVSLNGLGLAAHVTTEDGIGSVQVRFIADDALVASQSGYLRIVWTDGSIGKGGEPGPCEAPCPSSPLAENKPTGLLGAVPNPFNPDTHVRVTLSRPQRARLDVFDARGRHVRKLYEGIEGAGAFEFRWDGRDDSGGLSATGVYFARLDCEDGVFVSKMVLVK